MTTQEQWITIEPLRIVSLKGTLKDIDSHMPKNHGYSSLDKCNWAHETTHGLNSRIRYKSPGYNGLYALNDSAALIKEPPFTIRDICKQTLIKKFRGKIYKLYLEESQSYWNNQPLYIYDEWIAYTYGTMTCIDYNIGNTTRSYSFECTLEMTGYAYVIMTMLKNYPDYNNQLLREFFNQHLEKINHIYDNATENNWLNDTHKHYTQLLQQEKLLIGL